MAKRASDPRRRAWAAAWLEVQPLPEIARHIWGIYLRLRRRKPGPTFNGTALIPAPPIDFTDMHAFQAATRIRMSPWEVELIEELDNLYLASRSGQLPEPPTDEGET